MSKVSLRIYTREIESIIEQGHVDEAIAHCRHILKTFPKHLETYRLLGKAYLEAKRYDEAVDIFSRLLVSVPDDFVAHVGMSIINDEQRKLDDAIWHMERAFETQPSNPAIQGELQRLYGRRDGVEPPRVRMTRGALAHMYVQGELYPQAIAEIRAVLAQDPNRTDMQLLLAMAQFKAGQKADASENCSQILKKSPYCFDANRIMVDLLVASAGAENTQVYRVRVGELDPYAAFSKGSIFQSAEVADAAVNLERLEYKGDEIPVSREWSSSLGIGSGLSSPALSGGSVENEQPDWLKGFSASQPDPLPAASTPQADDNIPDFLRQAGWGQSTGPEQPTSFFDEPAAGNDLVSADIPDWLKGQMPSNPSGQPAAASDQTMETPDWLNDLGGSAAAFATDANPSQSPASEIPDWLGGAQTPASTPSFESSPAQPAEMPDWLSGLGQQEAAQPAANDTNDIPDWLGGLGDTPSKPSMESSPARPSETPDWMSGLQEVPAQQPAASVETLGSSAQEQDDAIAWLESLAAKHGAKPEELVTDPNKRSEQAPEWVNQAREAAGAVPQSGPAMDDTAAWLSNLEPSAAQPAQDTPDWLSGLDNEPAQPVTINNSTTVNVESLGSSAQEQDDAVAWLESLAAKHGAKPEELVTDPSKRSQQAPEWVNQAREAAQAQPEKEDFSSNAANIGEQFFAQFEEASSATPVDNDLWGDDKPGSNLPDWLTPAGEEQPAQTESEPVSAQGDLANWLDHLGNEPEASKTKDEPEWFAETKSASVADDSLPDWLSDLDDENPQPSKPMPMSPASSRTHQPAPVPLAADLPDWLQGVDDEPADADLPEWMSKSDAAAEADEEQPKPKPVTPADWHPVEEVRKPSASRSFTPKPKPSAAAPKPSREPVYSSIDDEEIVEEEKPIEESRKPLTPMYTRPAAAQPAAKTPVVQVSKQQPVATQPAEPKQPAPKRASKKVDGQSSLREQAKGELDRGDIPAALEHYERLIKRGKHLEETIADLSESLYRYPVEVGIWQTLGDAYMRANRLKEALEAYNKAEELIR